jgi:hypothetical protein
MDTRGGSFRRRVLFDPALFRFGRAHDGKARAIT